MPTGVRRPFEHSLPKLSIPKVFESLSNIFKLESLLVRGRYMAISSFIVFEKRSSGFPPAFRTPNLDDLTTKSNQQGPASIDR